VKKHTSNDLLLIAANYLDRLSINPLTVTVRVDEISIHLHGMPCDQFADLADSLEHSRFTAFASSEYIQVHLTGERHGVFIRLLVVLDRGPCIEVVPQLAESYVGAPLTVTAEQVRAFAPAPVAA
jgi:hypothetical protein